MPDMQEHHYVYWCRGNAIDHFTRQWNRMNLMMTPVMSYNGCPVWYDSGLTMIPHSTFLALVISLKFS
jgi:hypothetical protein